MKQNCIIKKFEARNSLFAIQGAYAAQEVFNKTLRARSISNGGYYYKDGFAWHLGDEKDYIQARKWLIKKIQKNSKWGSIFYNKQIKILNNFIDYLPKFLNDVKNLSGLNLVKYTRKFIKKAANATGPAYFTDWYAYNAHIWIKEFIPGLSDRQFNILTGPSDLSFTKEYEYTLALLKINKSNQSFENIVKKYFWVQDNYQDISRIDIKKAKDDFKKMSLREAKEIIAYAENDLYKNNKTKKQLLENLKINKLARSLLVLLSDFVNLQDKRKAAVFITNNVVFRAYQKILDYRGMKNPKTRDLILQSAFPFWIVDKSSNELIRLSRKASAGCLKMIYRKMLFGKEATEKFNKLVGIEDGAIQELKGYVASQGKVVGIVRIIEKISDFKKFHNGDILITSMTRPDMTSLLKCAAAFITDEGGITCHAAIVSRELKKPCIIGTKIATKVLKDGQLVEVDANSGIVKILKK